MSWRSRRSLKSVSWEHTDGVQANRSPRALTGLARFFFPVSWRGPSSSASGPVSCAARGDFLDGRVERGFIGSRWDGANRSVPRVTRRADARISSPVAGGSKFAQVLFNVSTHDCDTPRWSAPARGRATRSPRDAGVGPHARRKDGFMQSRLNQKRAPLIARRRKAIGELLQRRDPYAFNAHARRPVSPNRVPAARGSNSSFLTLGPGSASTAFSSPCSIRHTRDSRIRC